MNLLYFNSTHWDREWYQPFQAFRRHLVDMAGGLLDLLERDPAYGPFVFDGQTAVLEDILEVRPEWRERLARQIQANRLRVGPWYVMPDMFLVSGESLIRNLQRGHAVAAQFGGTAWPVGYMCDVFGNLAQTPQLLAGFGLELAVIWRGIADQAPPYLRWQGPDGSECLLFHLPATQSYGDFTGHVVGFWDRPRAKDCFSERAQPYVEQRRAEDPDWVVLMDGVDHAPAHGAIPTYLTWLKELYPQATVRQSDLSDLTAGLQAKRASLPLYQGEMVLPGEGNGYQGVLTHTLSARYPIKKMNDQATWLLEGLLEPAAAFDGTENERRLLDLGWKHLLLNHPHDSICGCSRDQVHQDMQYRFAQVEQLRDAILDEFVRRDRDRYLGTNIELECAAIGFVPEPVAIPEMNADGSFLLRVFNPLPLLRRGLVQLELRFPTDYPATYAEAFGYETLNKFRIFTAAGCELRYQVDRIERNARRRFYRYDLRTYNLCHVTLEAELIPFGWTSFTVKPAERPVRDWATLRTSQQVASNGLIELRTQADGTVKVTDLASGRSYEKLNQFVLDRDMGDGWNFARPHNSGILLDSCHESAVRLLTDGPLKTVFELTRTYRLPRELLYTGTITQQFGGIAESDEWAELQIRSEISLEKSSRLLQVKTSFTNTLKDYRLRLVVPTGIAGGYFAHQAFTVLERSAGRLSGDVSRDWKEADPLEKNFGGFAGKRDAHGGLALLCKYGVHELSADEAAEGNLNFTLLRAFRRTPTTLGEPDAQYQTVLTYEYAYMLLEPTDDGATVYDQWVAYRAENPAYQVRLTQPAEATDQASRLSVEGDLSFSCLKPAADGKGLILRLVNLRNRSGRATVRCATGLAAAWLTDLAERNAQPLPVTDGVLTIQADPWKIITVRIELNPA